MNRAMGWPSFAPAFGYAGPNFRERGIFWPACDRLKNGYCAEKKAFKKPDIFVWQKA